MQHPPRQLPSGWIAQFDPKYQRNFYVNTKTGQSQWEPPGVRRALFIGINYFRTRNELRGCIADVRNIHDWLIRTYAFDEICILTDDCPDPRGMPTRANIINGMYWLVKGAQPGDAFFFHFSGHGSRVKDRDGDEVDGYDETICPVDYQTHGQIIDDEINAILVRPLPQGVRLTAIFDCCHSGSSMDLPYTYSIDGNLQISVTDNTQKYMKHAANVGLALLTKNPMGVFREAKEIYSLMTTKADPNAAERTRREKGSPAAIVQLSGCDDSQTSADTSIRGQPTGAMSWAFIQVMSRRQPLTLTQLLRELRGLMRGKYSQTPQLSTSHPWNVNQDLFSIV